MGLKKKAKKKVTKKGSKSPTHKRQKANSLGSPNPKEEKKEDSPKEWKNVINFLGQDEDKRRNSARVPGTSNIVADPNLPNE